MEIELHGPILGKYVMQIFNEPDVYVYVLWWAEKTDKEIIDYKNW